MLAVAANSFDRAYPTEGWQAAYFAVDQRGALADSQSSGSPYACPPGLRRSVLQSPSALQDASMMSGDGGSSLEAADFERIMLPTETDGVSVMGAMLRATA